MSWIRDHREIGGAVIYRVFVAESLIGGEYYWNRARFGVRTVAVDLACSCVSNGLFSCMQRFMQRSKIGEYAKR